MINKIISILKQCDFNDLNRDNYQKILITLLKNDFTINKIICGSSKIIIDLEEIDDIIKIPFYSVKIAATSCKREMKIYELAQWQKVEKFYLPLKEIWIKDQYYIYLQEKVLSFKNFNVKDNQELFDKTNTILIQNLLKEKQYIFYNPQALNSRNFMAWLYYLYNYYSKDEMLLLLDFFTWPIFRQDVFGDNLGIHPNDYRPVIIDYGD